MSLVRHVRSEHQGSDDVRVQSSTRTRCQVITDQSMSRRRHRVGDCGDNVCVDDGRAGVWTQLDAYYCIRIVQTGSTDFPHRFALGNMSCYNLNVFIPVRCDICQAATGPMLIEMTRTCRLRESPSTLVPSFALLARAHTFDEVRASLGITSAIKREPPAHSNPTDQPRYSTTHTDQAR